MSLNLGLGADVHFWAISRRCQRKIVSGFTTVATHLKEPSARRMPFRRESAALVVR